MIKLSTNAIECVKEAERVKTSIVLEKKPKEKEEYLAEFIRYARSKGVEVTFLS